MLNNSPLVLSESSGDVHSLMACWADSRKCVTDRPWKNRIGFYV